MWSGSCRWSATTDRPVAGFPLCHGTRAQAMKMGMSTVTPTEVDVMFQAVPRHSYP